MYVKELTLRGFKSFANATTLRFEPGITAVVGPNGSGKSNIVDALAWVMGEQGAKTLRGTSMEDVIFAGTSSRPPLGRAQVSLTIDNSDGTLDIDYSEVTISRTIFRNGGSEYAINGSPVRLLDVQELLSDTGLGSHMHVVVGQGRLDSILRATPADNRAFIEEAAGILKHRKRKERALRKLQGTQENLDRVDDLLQEIHRQLGPLRRQARVSRRADSIQVSLRDAMSRLYADDALQITHSRDSLRHDLAAIRAQLAERQQELAETKIRIEHLEDLASKSSPAIDSINRTWQAMSQIEERFKSLSALAAERSRSWLSQIVPVGSEDPEILLKRAEELNEQAEEEKKLSEDSRLTLDKQTEVRAAREKQLASLRQMITQLRKSAQEKDAHIASIREMLARQEGQKQALASRRKDLDNQREAFAKQLQQAQDHMASLDEQTDQEDNSAETNLQEIRQKVDQARTRLDRSREEHRQVESRIISLKAKADALTDTLKSRGSTADLEHHQDLPVLGRLSQYIHIDQGWEEAVSRALGPFASAIVVPDYPAVSQTLTAARKEGMGRTVVLSAREGEDSGSLREAAEQDSKFAVPGLLPAVQVIHPNPSCPDRTVAQGVLSSLAVLLSDVALAPTLDQAQQALERAEVKRDRPHSWPFQVATADGELVTSLGGVGGSTKSPSDLSLAARAERALAECASFEERLTDLDAHITQEDQNYRDLRQQEEQAKTVLIRTKERRQQARRDKAATGQSIDSIKQRISQLRDRTRSLDAEEESYDQTLDDLRGQLQAVSQADQSGVSTDDLAERERQMETLLSQEREKEVAAKIAWTEANRKYQSYLRQASLLTDNARQAKIRRERIEKENATRREEAGKAELLGLQAQAAAQALLVHINRVSHRRQDLQKEASSHDSELAALRSHRNSLEPVVDDLRKKEHDLDVHRERVAAQYGQISQKALDDLGLSLEELMQSYNPSLPVPLLDDSGQPISLESGDRDATGSDDPEEDSDQDNGEGRLQESQQDSQQVDLSDAQALRSHFKTVDYDRQEQEKRLAKARRDLAALGKINPLATEEYDALETRHRYLNQQRKDVASSRDDLLKLISDLDSTMITVFKEAFDDTAAAFEKVFGTLFPGGKGRLVLENPDDLLTTGVIVEASPAGKRVKQLTLLSGGERSLTALALLFAIFTARPSPFYILDEVEAALDDINLTRLLDALNALRLRSQLIIITHQQRTMSIADALYGVTMRSDGVTAVVSQKLKQGTMPLQEK